MLSENAVLNYTIKFNILKNKNGISNCANAQLQSQEGAEKQGNITTSKLAFLIYIYEM